MGYKVRLSVVSSASTIDDAKACRVCESQLAHGVNPVFAVHPKARIVIIGQAPGRRVHESGVPWEDASGDRLRAWLGVSDETFYDETKVALLPMGFCYPGTRKGSDLPPRPECAPLWHDSLLSLMPNISLTLLFGQYAQRRYLGDTRKKNLTETVHSWREYVPKYLPLPHPSPRNRIWEARNPWFGQEVLPYLKTVVAEALS